MLNQSASSHMSYFTKVDQAPAPDLTWNLPEQKQKTVTIIGGNSNHFRTEIKIAEFMANSYPIKEVILVLPDSLQSKLPDHLSNITYIKSTDSGSFADASALTATMDHGDFNLILGDLSKNAITAQVMSDVLKTSSRSTLITRDIIDLIADHDPESVLNNSQIIFFASMPQLIKLFRAIYYPRVLLLSQSLVQVADALHKFTLSYPTKIITLHSDQILIAAEGEIRAIPLAKSSYAPFNFWNGELAAKIVVLNLFNPDNFLDATITGIMSAQK